MTLNLYRCKVCGTRWLLWPAGVGGTKDASWNLLDRWQRPGSCCDNAAMSEQVEHLRDIPLTVSGLVPSPPVADSPTPKWKVVRMEGFYAPAVLFLNNRRVADICSTADAQNIEAALSAPSAPAAAPKGEK